MNLLNDTIYAFTCEGEFLEFRVDCDKKRIDYVKKTNIEEFKCQNEENMEAAYAENDLYANV